jgi:hypothetical protein
LEEIVDKDIKSTISDFGNHSVTDDREGKQIARSRGSLYTHPQATSNTCRKPEKYRSKKDRASNSRCKKSKKKGTPTFETAAELTSAPPEWIFVPLRELWYYWCI